MSLIKNPSHPGTVLQGLYLEPVGMSADELAKAIGVDAKRVESLVAGRSTIDADIALRLARYYSSSTELWLNMQNSYDVAQRRKAIERELQAIQPRPVEDAA